MAVFKNQSLLIIKIQTNYTLTGATVRRILYKKPDNTTGFWEATLEGTTILTRQLTNGDIDQSGAWTFQAYAEVGGLKTYGDLCLLDFEEVIQ